MLTVEIEVSGRTSQRTMYRCLVDGEVIVASSSDPEHDAARALLGSGRTGEFLTMMCGRPGMVVDICEAAKWRMSETSRGFVRRPYQEMAEQPEA